MTEQTWRGTFLLYGAAWQIHVCVVVLWAKVAATVLWAGKQHIRCSGCIFEWKQWCAGKLKRDTGGKPQKLLAKWQRILFVGRRLVSPLGLGFWTGWVAGSRPAWTAICTECWLVYGELSVHVLSTAEVPFSNMPLRGSLLTPLMHVYRPCVCISCLCVVCKITTDCSQNFPPRNE